MKIVYLRKDGNMDCPWCGCGWLFTCMTCRKAFTFAKGVELETTWRDLALEDLNNRGNSKPLKEDVREWINVMKEILANLKVGARYVILDGSVISVDSSEIEFDGWHAHHHLSILPHLDALDNRAVLSNLLGNRDYWKENALTDKY
jgi:hypothetical protein